jgi:hypothetical protein
VGWVLLMAHNNARDADLTTWRRILYKCYLWCNSANSHPRALDLDPTASANCLDVLQKNTRTSWLIFTLTSLPSEPIPRSTGLPPLATHEPYPSRTHEAGTALAGHAVRPPPPVMPSTPPSPTGLHLMPAPTGRTALAGRASPLDVAPSTTGRGFLLLLDASPIGGDCSMHHWCSMKYVNG